MIFTDLIFVFAFLPIYLIISFCCRESWAKNAVSVAASIVFIAWGRQLPPVYYGLIAFPVFIIYILGFLSDRRRGAIYVIIGDASAILFAVFSVIASGTDGSLRSALISVGFILFALRCILYNKNVAEGMEPEKDLFALAAYLISFENMLIAPLADYESSKKALLNRSPSLSKMSAGLSAFIKGFAKTAIIGLAFDRVRLAAVEYDAFPWMNALILAVVTFIEVYIVTAGTLEMSCGLGLMSGLSPKLRTSAFLPRFRLTDHISEMWESLPGFSGRCIYGRSGTGVIVSLAVLSLATGIFIGFGASAGAFLGILLLAMALEGMSDRRNPAVDAVFSAAALALAFSTLIFGTAGGPSAFFSAFTTDYGYDITYALNDELLQNLPWLIIGAVVISPLYRAASAELRRCMSEDERFYAAGRIAETVVCALLLIIACASAAF